MTPSAERVRVLVADDHPLYREGVVRAIKERPELELVAESRSGREALAEIRRLAPDVAVLDMKMPELDGAKVLNAILRDGHGIALGVGIGMLAMSLGIVVQYRDQLPTAAIGGACALISGWMIVASQVLSLSLVQNLTFADALAIAGLAAAGMVFHELSTERVVHSLELRAGKREQTGETSRLAA